ncbi:hypothetical protein [Ramlibacter sp. 2FC]|uniref:hypothetical protein n=1 Tax=Ramlibacter sp. 2FC TaxID=2502188 RepID=UPI0010F5E8FF|nr:hypothetical protein [Ramlibacter sp. 2FC]
MGQHTEDIATKLLVAVTQALSAPSPSVRSPAFAVQRALAATQHPFGLESLEQWVTRFALMNGREYKRSLGWDIADNCWSDTADICVSGEQILLELLEWVEQGWNLSGDATSGDDGITDLPD